LHSPISILEFADTVLGDVGQTLDNVVVVEDNQDTPVSCMVFTKDTLLVPVENIGDICTYSLCIVIKTLSIVLLLNNLWFWRVFTISKTSH